jgi:hypothetical protein
MAGAIGLRGDYAGSDLRRLARSYLLHIGGLNWKKINPVVFGSMIQAVADDEVLERIYICRQRYS